MRQDNPAQQYVQGHAPTLHDALKHDADAIRFCLAIHHVIHVWDDIIDGDKPHDEAAINRAFRAALVDIPMNPFFHRHAAVLCPIVAASIGGWMAANAMERGPDREAWNRAHTLRVQGGGFIFATCAELVGGYEWGVLMAPYMHDMVQDEPLSVYIEELERRHAAA